MRNVWIRTFLSGIVLFFLSCKQGSKSGSDQEGINYEDQLVVELNIKVPQDDKFELFYRKKKQDFSSERSITAEVKGSEDFQLVVFALDILEFPTHMRLDFGKNPAQGEMSFGHLAFRYNDASHTFTKEEIKKFFRPNAGLKFNYEELSLQTAEVNGKYDPYLNSNDIAYFVNKLILY